MRFSVLLDMDENDNFYVTLTDKITGIEELIKAPNYSSAIAKCYSHLLRTMKEAEGM